MLFLTVYHANKLKLYAIMATVLLAVQIVSALFCGDVDCLPDVVDKKLTALTCNVPDGRAAQASISDMDRHSICLCFCHVLIDQQPLPSYLVSFVATPHLPSVILLYSPALIDNIDHPPTA
ncbi:hypothetical protein A2V82_13345 [candidate division KSB1 bacterium RBG_16_48_16]|nr:MAG: hypothetical protein A2V82_13345 [candidate division KSB1 bacterium RBG_16_48_16]